MIDSFIHLITKGPGYFSLEDGGDLAIIILTQIGVSLGVPLAIWRTFSGHTRNKLMKSTAVLNDRDKKSNKFRNGVTMLGHQNISVRHGGIFMLESLVDDNFVDYYHLVTKMMCTFIRDQSAEFQKELSEQDVSTKDIFLGNVNGTNSRTAPRTKPDALPTDIQSALNALSNIQKLWQKRNQKSDPKFFKGDLRDAYLVKAYLPNGNLTHVNLSRANLHSAMLNNVDLSNANLKNVDLTNAQLNGAKILDAQLKETNFTNANLSGSQLIGANLFEANFAHSNFHETDFIFSEINRNEIKRSRVYK